MQVSWTNHTANLKTHQDGYRAIGWFKTGCHGRNRAKAAGLYVPLSVAEAEKARANNKNNPASISSFVTVGPKGKYDNLVFNQMAWLRKLFPGIECPISGFELQSLTSDLKHICTVKNGPPKKPNYWTYAWKKLFLMSLQYVVLFFLFNLFH